VTIRSPVRIILDVPVYGLAAAKTGRFQ